MKKNTNILEVNNIKVEYSDFTLNDVSFNIKKGNVVGFIGKNGAGKTTTIKSIMGVINFKKGDIFFQGEPISLKNLREFRQKVGYVGDVNSYFSNIPAKDIAKFASSLFRDWDNSVFEQYACKLFNINLDKKIKELSSGNKVKLNLSIALSHNSDLLILDEPTSGIDPVIRNELLDILYDYSRIDGKSVLFSTHITQDIEKRANRVICIENGRIVLDLELSAIAEKFIKIPFGYIPNEARERLLNKGINTRDGLIIEKDFMDLSCKTQKPSLDEIILYLSEVKQNV